MGEAVTLGSEIVCCKLTSGSPTSDSQRRKKPESWWHGLHGAGCNARPWQDQQMFSWPENHPTLFKVSQGFPRFPCSSDSPGERLPESNSAVHWLMYNGLGHVSHHVPAWFFQCFLAPKILKLAPYMRGVHKIP